MKHSIIAAEVKGGKWSQALERYFGHEFTERFKGMDAKEIEARLDSIYAGPVDGSIELTWEMMDLYYVVSWAKAFELLGLPQGLQAMEVASGDVTVVPRAVDLYSQGTGSYLTANLNKDLTNNFIRNTRNLEIGIRVVEDNALNLDSHCSAESFDVVAFQHAVNDIIQTIVADREGIDTVNNSWWDILSPMIKATEGYYRQGRLAEVARDEFMRLISVCCGLLKKGGCMVFNTTMYQLDLDSGYSRELYSSYVHIAREWIAASGLPLEEVGLEGYDPQWWLVVRKI